MARILVISPSGEVYDHDNVRRYRHSQLQSHINHYHNIGDAFVFDSSLKLLNFETLEELPITSVDEAMLDRLNAEFDYVFLRGSNYVHAQMNWSRTAEVLRRLKLPVLTVPIIRRSAPGMCVTMLMAPPMVLRPKRVPCGPFRISMRSTSSRFWLAPIVRARYTPSR